MCIGVRRRVCEYICVRRRVCGYVLGGGYVDRC